MIENQTVPLNSVETEFSQMPNLLCEIQQPTNNSSHGCVSRGNSHGCVCQGRLVLTSRLLTSSSSVLLQYVKVSIVSIYITYISIIRKR